MRVGSSRWRTSGSSARLAAAGYAALSALLCWCSPQGAGTVEPARPAPRDAARRAQIELLVADADVWAYRARVQGVARSPAAPVSCAVTVAGQVFSAPLDDGSFGAEIDLAPGPNAVRAHCRERDGRERVSAPITLTVRLDAAPVARAHGRVDGSKLVLDGSGSRANESSGAPIAQYAWFSAGPLGRPARAPLGTGAELVIETPQRPGEYVYELHVRDAQNEHDTARVHVSVGDAGAVVAGSPSDRPPWLRSAIVYGLSPPLLGDPPLRAVARRVPELAELGVTALWLSPIFDSPDGDYGYAVRDYFKVRDDYGTAEDLAHLVAEAHARGLRVLLDIVPNHTSDEHPYFVQAERLARRSRYFDFYDRDAQGRPTHYFDWEHLPNLEFDNAEVERFMFAAGAYWIRRFAVDGYRVDAAWGVAQRDPSFFPRWTEELRRARPDALLIAEASARDPAYVWSGFDAAYDWTDEPGRWAWQDVFTADPGIVQRLHAAVMRSAERTPPARVMRFLNNNDTGARFITRHGEPMTRVATAALLTLPGVPCLFAFDEVGAEFEPYAAQGPITPPENPALRRWYERLIALRKSSPALHGDGFTPLHVGTGDEVYVYRRSAKEAGTAAGADAPNGGANPSAIVALNFGDRAATVRVALPAALKAGPRTTRLTDALTGERVRVRSGELELHLAPHGALILEPR